MDRAEDHDQSFVILGVPGCCLSLGGGAGALSVDDVEKSCIAKGYCPTVPPLCVVLAARRELRKGGRIKLEVE